jgi:hypothetical protein
LYCTTSSSGISICAGQDDRLTVLAVKGSGVRIPSAPPSRSRVSPGQDLDRSTESCVLYGRRQRPSHIQSLGRLGTAPESNGPAINISSVGAASIRVRLEWRASAGRLLPGLLWCLFDGTDMRTRVRTSRMLSPSEAGCASLMSFWVLQVQVDLPNRIKTVVARGAACPAWTAGPVLRTAGVMSV